jgi:phage-related protein
MYNIIFYEDKKGKSEVKEFIQNLNKKAKTDKNYNMQFNKIVAYFDLLEELGTRVGKPVTKHLDGEIWELRPNSNRILYAYYKDNTFIMLHQFVKKTQKTPPREIEKAIRNLKDYKERND